MSISAILSFKRWDLIKVGIFSSLFTALILCITYELGFVLFSNAELILKEWWMLYEETVGWRIWELPLTEIIFALSYGFAAPVLYSAVTGVQYKD